MKMQKEGEEMLLIPLEAAGCVSMAEHRLCSRGSTKAGRDLKISGLIMGIWLS